MNQKIPQKKQSDNRSTSIECMDARELRVRSVMKAQLRTMAGKLPLRCVILHVTISISKCAQRGK
jgi:hypothetical protein